MDHRVTYSFQLILDNMRTKYLRIEAVNVRIIAQTLDRGGALYVEDT